MSEETTANPTPSFRVTVAGTKYGFVPLESDASVEGGVERLVVESHVDMISVAEVTFSGMTEWPFKIGD